MRLPRKLVLLANTAFHLIWRTHNREFLLGSAKEKLKYLHTVHDDFMKQCKDVFVLYCYNVMGNHVHKSGGAGNSHDPISSHMRRAHSRFAQGYNRRHGRMGTVVNDRPKTKPVENDEYLKRLFFYIDTNPVRAGLTKAPDVWARRKISSCRFYAWGEKNEFTDMLTIPEWYLQLGSTPEQRQREYRSLLNKYLADQELRADPKDCDGLDLGSESWKATRRAEARKWRKAHSPRGAGAGAYEDTS